ncbi:MAG TPA: hypothetical protein VJK54_11250, partial [Chthoniobacterales bacterium]|nr:hypothetical protein [Chthoniobacterales bacterium]
MQLNHMITEQACRFIQIPSFQKGKPERFLRFFLYFLLFSCLQLWRLMASTPGGEELLKYVCEEGTRFVDEVIEEEGSINHQPPLNVAQTASHTDEEGRVFIVASPLNIHSIADSTSSSLFSEVLETVPPVEQPISLLDNNIPLVEVPVTITRVYSSPKHMLELPQDLIDYIVEFLILPEVKQVAYKTEHQKAIQELRTKYPNLADKITTWNQAINEWSACSILEKDLRYQKVTTLIATMPRELDRLIVLSLAMKIIEDAIAYRKFLHLTFEKYDRDAQTEEAKTAATRSKIILLAQLDGINNNLEKLEKAVDAIIRLFEQSNRCFAATAVAISEGRGNIARSFQSGAIAAHQAITPYHRFGQKMKEGEPITAYQFCIKGLSLECDALMQEYSAQSEQSFANGNNIEAANFKGAAKMADLAIAWLKNAVRTRNKSHIEVSQAREQAVQYYLKGAQAKAHGNSMEVENFKEAAKIAIWAIEQLEYGAQAKNEGNTGIARACKQTAKYCFQAARFCTNGNSTERENLKKAAKIAIWAIERLKHAVQAKNKGHIEVTKAYKQAAKYYFKAARAFANGNNTEAENFKVAVEMITKATREFKDAVQAKNEGNAE